MKKFLSLVLALAMTVSLVTIGAGAKDFTDAEDIQYVEAVEVMTAIGVVDGDTAGNFNPAAGLTRGAAAKIICNLILGPTTAAALNADANPYKDVDKNSTFAGYIAFCQKEGIISGYADGTFKPAAPLTGYAFMKMLLGALGYDVEVEGYTGANWSINVAKRAINIGLDDGLVDAFNGSDYVTREEAMLYSFNALQADMVEYDTTITIGDVTIAGSKAAVMANSTRTDGNIGAKDGVMQFAEKYFSNLKNSGDTDAFMRPATTWKIKAETVGTYSKTPDAAYTAAVKTGTIYADLGLSSKGIADENTAVYEDGKDVTGGTNAAWTGYDIVKGGRDEIGGNGAVTEVYYDADTNTADIVVVNTYVAKVGAVYAKSTTKDAYITLSTNSADGFTAPAGSSDFTFETDAFSKDAIVAYTYSLKDGEKCIQSVADVDKVTGKMTTYTALTGTVTVDGTKYTSNTKSASKIELFATAVERGNDVTVYLDENGYILKVDADTAAQYAVVLNYLATAGDFNDTKKAKLFLSDGTTKTVEVKLEKTSGVSGLTVSGSGFSGVANGFLSEYDIVKYTINSDGVYELDLVADAQTGHAGANDVLVTNGVNSIAGLPANQGEANILTTPVVTGVTGSDGKTLFMVMNDKGTKTTYSVYEGFANVPTIKNGPTTTTTAPFVAVYRDASTGSVADVVFIKVTGDMTISSQNQDMIYIGGNGSHDDSTGKGQSYSTELGYYYEYTGYVNGEEQTVRTEDPVTKALLISGPAYNDKGIIIGAEAYSQVGTVNSGVYSAGTTLGSMGNVMGTDYVTNSVVDLGGTAYAYTKNVNVFRIDVDGKLTASTIDSIGKDANDLVLFKTNSDGLLTDVYVKTVDIQNVVNNGGGNRGAITGTSTVAIPTAGELASSAAGAYTFTSSTVVTGFTGWVEGTDYDKANIDKYIFFVCHNAVAGTNVTLTITDSDNHYWTETGAAPNADVVFYTGVAPATCNAGDESFDLSHQNSNGKPDDWAAGNYNWKITQGTTVLASGSFTL